MYAYTDLMTLINSIIEIESKYKDDCYENLPYDYDLKLDKIDEGNDHYSFYSKSSYDIRKNEQISIYDFFSF